MPILQSVFVILLVLVVAWLSIHYSATRSVNIIDKWAAENSYTILSAERRYFALGPFFWRTNRSQTVFYVTVLDNQGRTRHAFVRCGGLWLGLWSDEVTVEWDD